jgi:hypothetical protein
LTTLEQRVYIHSMRADNKNPGIVYKNFGDWLLNYPEHLIFIVLLFFGYYIYILTTTEIRQ